MAQPSRLFHVYFYYPDFGRVVYIDKTIAVSAREAASNVRWNRFGQLSIETLFEKKGIKIEAAVVGSRRDLFFEILSCGGRKPARPKKISKKVSTKDKQMLLPGFEQNAQLL